MNWSSTHVVLLRISKLSINVKNLWWIVDVQSRCPLCRSSTYCCMVPTNLTRFWVHREYRSLLSTSRTFFECFNTGYTFSPVFWEIKIKTHYKGEFGCIIFLYIYFAIFFLFLTFTWVYMSLHGITYHSERIIGVFCNRRGGLQTRRLDQFGLCNRLGKAFCTRNCCPSRQGITET